MRVKESLAPDCAQKKRWYTLHLYLHVCVVWPRTMDIHTLGRTVTVRYIYRFILRRYSFVYTYMCSGTVSRLTGWLHPILTLPSRSEPEAIHSIYTKKKEGKKTSSRTRYSLNKLLLACRVQISLSLYPVDVLNTITTRIKLKYASRVQCWADFDYECWLEC